MSKILRRPMFRGGPVDSRGTGITSGLIDTPTYATGGRVGYNQGAFVVQPPGAKGKSIFDIQDILAMGGAPMTGQQILDFAKANQMNLGRNFKINPKTKFIPNEVIENAGTENEVTIPYSEKIKEEGFQTYEDPNEKYLGSEDPQGSQDELVDLTTEEVTEKLKPKDDDNNDTTGNNTSSTVVDEKDVIRQQAELFKELLGESNEKKLKDARIQDLSDLGLDIFAKSQQEGATVGSTLGGAAANLVGKDSRVDKAKASIEKGDQTATVLAINDYIAGKRSKEEIQEYFAKIGAKARLDAKSAAEYIQASDEINFAKKVKEGFQSYAGAKGAGVPRFKETTSVEMKENFEFSPEDIGVVFIETDTNRAYTYNEEGNPEPIYSM